MDAGPPPRPSRPSAGERQTLAGSGLCAFTPGCFSGASTPTITAVTARLPLDSFGGSSSGALPGNTPCPAPSPGRRYVTSSPRVSIGLSGAPIFDTAGSRPARTSCGAACSLSMPSSRTRSAPGFRTSATRSAIAKSSALSAALFLPEPTEADRPRPFGSLLPGNYPLRELLIAPLSSTRIPAGSPIASWIAGPENMPRCGPPSGTEASTWTLPSWPGLSLALPAQGAGWKLAPEIEPSRSLRRTRSAGNYSTRRSGQRTRSAWTPRVASWPSYEPMAH